MENGYAHFGNKIYSYYVKNHQVTEVCALKKKNTNILVKMISTEVIFNNYK